MLKKLRVLIKYIWFKIKRDILKKEFKTIAEFRKDCKSMTKNDIIKEIATISGKINRTPGVITPQFKKELRGYSKKKLISVLTKLKVHKQFGGK